MLVRYRRQHVRSGKPRRRPDVEIFSFLRMAPLRAVERLYTAIEQFRIEEERIDEKKV